MHGANDLTEDRCTSAELDKCAEIGLSIGDLVIHRGEQCRVDEVKQLKDLIAAIHAKLEYGDVFQWDDGDECWNDMRTIAGF